MLDSSQEIQRDDVFPKKFGIYTIVNDAKSSKEIKEQMAVPALGT